jgi:multiple sugar transport system ATP-binding protein
VRAVEGLTLHVEAGEYVVLVGPSGCGKTTTLRLVAGLESPAQGKVLIDGQDVTPAPPHERGVALVSQEASLFPHLSVCDNLAFGPRVQRWPARQIAEHVEKAARRLGLVELLGRMPEHLSGGERRRVALGGALVRRPRLLLLDEPLSGLDTPARLELRDELARLHRDDPRTTLHVTHDQEEAMTLGGRVAVMRAGRVVQVGPPRELYERPLDVFVAGFIGSPPMNFLRRPREGVECLLGVRPRDIQLSSEEGADLVARVEGVLSLGHETILELRDEETVRVVVRGDPGLRPGDRVGLRLPPEGCHWFEARTGTRLDAR